MSTEDALYGGADGDALYGEAGTDTIYGGAGNDFIFTGTGSDVVVFEAAAGVDQIYDFDATGADKLRFAAGSGPTSFADLAISDGGSYTVVVYAAGTQAIYLWGTPVAQVDASACWDHKPKNDPLLKPVTAASVRPSTPTAVSANDWDVPSDRRTPTVAPNASKTDDCVPKDCVGPPKLMLTVRTEVKPASALAQVPRKSAWGEVDN